MVDQDDKLAHYPTTKEFVMRILSTAIVFAPLMLAGTLPAISGELVSRAPSNAAIQLADDANSTSDRNSYLQRVKNEMQEWQRKLHDFSLQSKDKGQSARDSSGNALNDAWNKTRAASHKLQTASAERWESAKTSFEKASRRLGDAWHQVHPEAK